MKIAVRLDDIAPDMNWKRFLKFKALLDRYQVKPLIGVVPDNKDEHLKEGNVKDCPFGSEGFWEYIKELQKEGWVIAMHGCYHRYTTDKGGIFPLNNFSEFAGLPFERQRELLYHGKKCLEEKGIRTDIFMAPAHSYDRNTLRALKAVGFNALTDGFGQKPYRFMGLTFYPISFRLAATFKKKKGYSTMVVHPATVEEEDLKKYQGYFEKTDVEWISYERYLTVKETDRGIGARVAEYIMAGGKSLISRMRR